MSVLPLTLAISLCLALTFIVFFARAYAQRHFASAEQESLLPLAEEERRIVSR